MNYYLKQCDEHIEFTIKVHTMAFTGLFGGGETEQSAPKGQEIEIDGEKYIDGYKVATVEDLEWLASILSG